jgi:PAS domain S-box-containing protein
MKILLVDDDEQNLYMLESLLKGSNHEVVLAKNGEEAFKRLESSLVDLIISDTLMPVMDGFQLCHKVKVDDRFKQIPFVFYSSTYKEEEDIELARKLGATKYLIKPMEPQKFLQEIQTVSKEANEGKYGKPSSSLPEEKDVYRLYNERLVSKLEHMTSKLEIELTERKKSEQIAKAACAYAEKIVDAMREPLIVLDTDLKVISANSAFYKNFKIEPNETEGRSIYDLDRRQWDIPKLRELLEEILPKSIIVNGCEIEHNFATIGRRTMIFNVRHLLAAQRILITIEDTTGRKQAEKELVQSKDEEFKAVFDNVVDGILIADMENKKFHMCNNSICQMLGYSPEEIKDLGVMDIHPEKDLPNIISQFEMLVKGDIRLAEDIPVKRKDGSIFYADINVTTIVIAGKTYLIGFFHDTIRRKQAEVGKH